MGKNMVVPKFANEAEEVPWWDAHRSDVESEIRRRMRRKPLTLQGLLSKEKPSQPITLRVAKEDLDTARRLASERGLGYQNYLKMLKPFLQQPPRIKEPLSIKAIFEHRLERRHPMPSGGTDDVFHLQVNVENDGEQTARDFKLRLDFPSEFIDGGPPYGLSVPGAPPGFSRLEITNERGNPPTGDLYRATRSLTLIAFNYAVRDETKRLYPEALEKKVTATVFSGNMTPKTTVMTMAELGASG